MIDYALLAQSVDYYTVQGFNRVESPWLVTEEINDITCPPGGTKYYVTKNDRTKTFVASGEQSFLYLINKGFLPTGKYQTITPCMRNDAFDKWHTKYFMKNELIQFGSGCEDQNLEDMLEDAYNFFKSVISPKHRDKIIIEKTHDGYDINFNEIEIGSYGIRSCEFVKWVYGTGLAEPRFSRIKNYVESI